MADFHFLRPYWLLTWLPTVLIFWGFLRQKNLVVLWRESIDPHLLEYLLVGDESPKKIRPVYALFAGCILTTLALAGPSWRLEPSPFLDDEAGLMIVLKVNRSMNGKDVQPSRLIRSKHKIRDLLELRKGAASGLIVYSGSAHMVMPLTTDDRVILTMLEDLTPELMPVEGDVLESALDLAAKVIRQTGKPGSVLVIADAFTGEQSAQPEMSNGGISIQFLSITPQGRDLDKGLQIFVERMNATVTPMTVDSTDVEQVVRRARIEMAAVSTQDQGERWRDEGYWMLPLIALQTLMWFRKGWVVP